MRTETTAAAVTPELVMQLVRPGEVELPAAGRRVAFVAAPAFREKGEALRGRILAGPLGAAFEPGGEEDANHALPRFSPDGARLAYASDVGHSGRMSLWIDDRELGEIAGSVEEIVWAPDGGSLLVLAADLGADRAGTATATRIQEAGAAEEDPIVLRPARHWRRLWLVDADSGATREGSPEGVNVFEFGWAGAKVAAVCTDEPSEGAWYDAWIGLLDLDARTADRVHTAEWQLQCPAISPGGRIAWVEGFSSDRGAVTGTVRVRGTGALAPELDASWVAFADEETLWVAGWRGAGSFFGRLGLDGSFEELWAGDALVGSRFGPDVAPSADGSRIASVLESADEPAEVSLFENGGWRTLTGLNAELAPGLRSAEWRPYSW